MDLAGADALDEGYGKESEIELTTVIIRQTL